MKRRSLFLAIVLLVLSTGALNTWTAIGPKADALWLHYIGYRWFEPERARAAEQANRLDGEYGALEMARREVVFRNYPLAAVTQYAVHGVESLPIAIGAGLYLQYAIATLLFIGGLSALRRIVPIGLSLASLALTTLLPGPKPTDHLLLYSGFEAVANFIAVIVAPGESFSPMSPWPKNIVLLLALPMFALRWEGRRRLAYLLCLAMMLFHISLGLVVLLLVLAIDVLRRIVSRLNSADWDAWLAMAGCAGGGILGIAIYMIADPAMPWDVPSAFVQLATRLFVLGSLILVLWCATKATGWLWKKMDGDATIVANVFAWGVVVLMSYAAIGGLWERSRIIRTGYENLAASSVPKDMETVYFDVLTELKSGQYR